MPLSIWFGHGQSPSLAERHTELRDEAVVAARPVPGPAAHATASEPGIWSIFTRKGAQMRARTHV